MLKLKDIFIHLHKELRNFLGCWRGRRSKIVKGLFVVDALNALELEEEVNEWTKGLFWTQNIKKYHINSTSVGLEPHIWRSWA